MRNYASIIGRVLGIICTATDFNSKIYLTLATNRV